MKSFKTLLAGMAIGVAALAATPAIAAEEEVIGYSHYTGWEPWAYINEYGLIDKWNQKTGANVRIEFYNDYGASLDMMTSEELDGVTATNMDAFLAPASGGVEMVALINGDYSNGNDAIVTHGKAECGTVVGKEVLLFEGTVSHYLLDRYLTSLCNSSLENVSIENTSDADIVASFLTSPESVAVTWNPPLQVILADPETDVAFSSKDTPGEILDTLYVRKDMSDAGKRTLVGAWYEAMSIMASKGKHSREMINFMAEYSGATPNEFKAQMRTTEFFITPEQAVSFTEDAALKTTMQRVRDFVWKTGLVSNDIKSADHIGVKFADGTVQGDPNNVMITFDVSYMKLAAEGKL